MDMSALVIRIVLLLLPGALGASFYWKLKGRTERKDWEDLLEVSIFSLLSYGLYGFAVKFINWKWNSGVQFTALEAFLNESVSVRWQDILTSSIIGLGLAFVAAYSYQFKAINKFGKLIRATTRFGEEDVWDFLHRSKQMRGAWVVVRDHKVGLYYSCWIQAFSDSGKERELLLREVNAYDNASAEWRYKTDIMYLSRKQDDLTIETWPDLNEPKASTSACSVDGIKDGSSCSAS
jgi:hypothetical protein